MPPEAQRATTNDMATSGHAGGQRDVELNTSASNRTWNNHNLLVGPSWTDVLPKTEHCAFFKNTDYSSTRLGPITEWGPALRLYTTMVFADSRAACLYWGPGKTAVYNEAFGSVAGKAHPRLMGSGFQDGFPEITEQFMPVFAEAARTATTIDVDNMLIFPERNGFVEETYFIGQFIPIRGDSGEVEGFYNTCYESTQRVLHERRRAVLEDVVRIPPQPVDQTLDAIMHALGGNPHDICMALLYMYTDGTSPGANDLELRGSIGVPKNHPCAPETADLDSDRAGLISLFRQARDSSQPVVLSESDGSLQAMDGLFDNIDWRGYGEPSRDIVILPLSSSGSTLGFYVQGCNPRRAYDEHFQMSLADLARQIEAKWISSLGVEEADKREQALERRAADSEHRLQHLARSAPFGMCQISHNHTIQFANDQFWEITGHERAKPSMTDFCECLHPDEVASATQCLGRILDGGPRDVREIRLKRKYIPPVAEPGAEEHSAWILAVSFPLVVDGKVKLLMGYVSDISRQKWAESVQSRNSAAALEAKRRQEDFIDTTSHEMRNPLTAMMQLADGISASLEDKGPMSSEEYRSIVEDNIEAANTILACASHQKRVIDDVLILSRLESRMLSITPVPASPTAVVDNVLRMFSRECTMNDINLMVVRDSSYDALKVNSVLIDTSRLTQILINLISNAIKFTISRPVRKITVTYGAQSRFPPRVSTGFGEMEWMPSLEDRRQNIALNILASGESPCFLYFCVQDTGTGMQPNEMKRLFKRFSQASSRTHIKYGGSGIGLYISRQLAEKQGGGVGVTSVKDKGSAFGFYIETCASTTARSSSKESLERTGRESHNSSDSTTQKAVDSPKTSVDGRLSAERSHELPLRPTRTHFDVLIVEDNLINQRILAKQLRSAGCTVNVANHGQEALECLEKSPFWKRCTDKQRGNLDSGLIPIEVVLLDWEMPVMNGLECARRIRELEKTGKITKKVPLIAVTANVREEQMEQAIAAGFDTVLQKPFIVAELLRTIQQQVQPD